jgi:hypothetical protein
MGIPDAFKESITQAVANVGLNVAASGLNDILRAASERSILRLALVEVARGN